ncbi:hypothetical protein GYMLUDRAFT_251846 [Collybiopsis luxurians FD-317 M1]|uniref:Uncharacterized protein n=1 Tax=Collybiopsis luxurians FD-317 M1 TaxID=944289 RepID=A0A0D0BQ23_9AGAR|nr:hypothetical protein GYMLUDRAFT_251846 [Collybiopsis luxurians FD-317 M1]
MSTSQAPTPISPCTYAQLPLAPSPLSLGQVPEAVHKGDGKPAAIPLVNPTPSSPLIPTVVLDPLPTHKHSDTIPNVKLGPTATQSLAPTGSKKTAHHKPEPVPSMWVTRSQLAPAEPTTTSPAPDVPTPPVAPLSSINVIQPEPSKQPDVQPVPMLMDPISEVPEEEDSGVTPISSTSKPQRSSKKDKQKAKATGVLLPPSTDGDVSNLDLHAGNGSDGNTIYNQIVSNKKHLHWPISPSDSAYSSSAEEHDLCIAKI